MLDKRHCLLNSDNKITLEVTAINIIRCHELGNNLKLCSHKMCCIVKAIHTFNQQLVCVFVLTGVIEIST